MAQIRMRTILVAVADPASRKQHAVDRGAWIAKAVGARLVLFHAAFAPALSGGLLFDSARLARSRGAFVSDQSRLIEKRAEKLRAAGITADVNVSWEEPAHEAVVRAALRERADLVVVGRHELRANAASPFRLTDWELMRLCPRPLLVVHPAVDILASHVVLAAIDPTHAHDKPGSLDVAIVRHAAAIAEALGVECHAVHSMSRLSYPAGSSATTRKRFDQRMLSRMNRVIREAGAHVSAAHIVRGSVAQSVPKLAARIPAQTVAMGIISRRWLERFIIGDTAESVIRDAACDLLLIKPANFRLRLGRIRKEALAFPRADDRR